MTGISHSERFPYVHKTPVESRTALAGQMRPHAPHSMHCADSMTNSPPRSPEMQSTGQMRAQAVQPVHAGMILNGMVYTPIIYCVDR